MNFGDDFEVARQGSVDGLCGLYALANFFTRVADPEDPRLYARKCLRAALEAMENDGHLTATNLISGFWQGRLVVAANSIAEKLRVRVDVKTLTSLIKSEGSTHPVQLVKALKSKGAIIFNLNAPVGHWILAYATPSGAVRYDDSATGSTTRLNAQMISEREFDLSKGLVLTYA